MSFVVFKNMARGSAVLLLGYLISIILVPIDDLNHFFVNKNDIHWVNVIIIVIVCGVAGHLLHYGYYVTFLMKEIAKKEWYKILIIIILLPFFSYFILKNIFERLSAKRVSKKIKKKVKNKKVSENISMLKLKGLIEINLKTIEESRSFNNFIFISNIFLFVLFMVLGTLVVNNSNYSVVIYIFIFLSFYISYFFLIWVFNFLMLHSLKNINNRTPLDFIISKDETKDETG